jgi:hypothetical protein
MNNRPSDRPSEIPVWGALEKYPLMPRTKAEWEEDMMVKVSIYGRPFRAVKDVIYQEEYGLMIVWPDGKSEGVDGGANFGISVGWDHRLLYTQNREVIGIKPEYAGTIAESWGPLN